MRVALATSAGHPGRPNEDFVGAVPSAVVLLDGASSPGHPGDLQARRRVVRPQPRWSPPSATSAEGRRGAPDQGPRATASRTSPSCTADTSDVTDPSSPQATVALMRTRGRRDRVAGPRGRLRRPRPRRHGQGADRPEPSGAVRAACTAPLVGLEPGSAGVHARPAQRDRRPEVAPEPNQAATGSPRTTRPRPSTLRPADADLTPARRRARSQQRREPAGRPLRDGVVARPRPGWLGSTVRTSCSPRSGRRRSDCGPAGGPDDATIAVCTLSVEEVLPVVRHPLARGRRLLLRWPARRRREGRPADERRRARSPRTSPRPARSSGRPGDRLSAKCSRRVLRGRGVATADVAAAGAAAQVHPPAAVLLALRAARRRSVALTDRCGRDPCAEPQSGC